MKLRFLLLLLLAVAAGFALAAWRMNPAVARVNGQALRAADLDAELRARFGEMVLQDMIGERLVAQAARTYGVDVPPKEMDLWVADFRETPEARTALQAGTLTPERLRRNLATVVPLYYLTLVDVPEEDRKQFFRDHRTELQEVRMRHMLLGSEEEAADIASRIKTPEDFATLARVHSLDPNTRDTGGDLGLVPRPEAAASLQPEDVEKLFTMKSGEVSPPMLADSGGWHLFLVEGRRVDYESLKRRVVQEMARERVGPYLEGLKERAAVEVLIATPSPSPSPHASP